MRFYFRRDFGSFSSINTDNQPALTGDDRITDISGYNCYFHLRSGVGHRNVNLPSCTPARGGRDRPPGQPAGHRRFRSQGTTGAAQLADRPILRSGEILETVPGVIITQHAGGGKANQYFLRGFNLDHGTDFAVFLDDMPLNLPSHAHGEGYSDMNIVIPEFVERVDYEKGPYYADVGNYGSAGSAHLVFYKVLPEDFVTVEGGMYGYERGAFGFSQKLGPGNLLYGGEVYHDDGPWVHPDDYRNSTA